MTTELVTKNVLFDGAEILAIQNRINGKIYAGINSVLRDFGFDERQIEYRRNKWCEDKVIRKGIQKFSYPSMNGGNQETYCIDIDKLPLALAKIEITPRMEREMKDLSARLEKYQDECAETLKNAFLTNKMKREELSPHTQALIALTESIARQEIEQKRQAEQIARLEQKQESIKETFEPIKENWRQEIQKKINRIQKATGRQHNLLRAEIYSTLESRAGCDLETRLNNKRNRMRRDGNTVTAINKTNYIDVIAEDVRIKEIFEKIVTEYELKYC